MWALVVAGVAVVVLVGGVILAALWFERATRPRSVDAHADDWRSENGGRP